MVSRVIPVEDFDLAIIGATGDLSERKILPSLYRRFHAGQIPDGARVVGAARAEMSREAFCKFAGDAVREHVSRDKADANTLAAFLAALDYTPLDASKSEGWETLAGRLRPDVVRAFYFSVGPHLFGPIAERLHRHGVVNDRTRIVLEKPFGKDLQTARELNAVLAASFDEHQIYRIDHYLGKETVQNLMAVRFGNMLFEPLWNAHYVDHIQITVAETIGIGGRAAFYDRTGAMRDMVQNHMMQLLCLIAMEPPSMFNPDPVRDEKLKVIRALDPVGSSEIVRGQYGAGDGKASYIDEAASPDSATESFIALKCHVSNWRWKGTPFYLRTGKRLRARGSEIAVVFKDPPHSIFGPRENRGGNVLVIRLQPDEGMNLHVTIKEPGPGGMRLIEVPLDMSFAEALGPKGSDIPDAYERLIMDVIRGNQTLFMSGDEVEAAWAWTDPIVAEWEARGDRPKPYDPGSSGPDDALMLMHRDGRRWRSLGP